MGGIVPLRRCQIGKQDSLAGGAVAATKIMHVNATWLHNRQVVISPRQPVGRMISPHRVYIPSTGGDVQMESDCTYEELPYILDCALGTATPVRDLTGGYLYAYVLPISTQPTLSYYTLELGDDQQEYEAPGGFVHDFELLWQAPPPGGGGGENGAWHYRALWQTQAVSKSTFTASLALTTVETVLAPKLYIDTNLANLGATQQTTTLLGASLKWGNNIGVLTGDGTQAFTFVKTVVFDNEPTLTLTLEHDAFGEALYDNFVAGTQMAVRLTSEGSSIPGGSTYTKKTLQINFYGTILEPPAFGEQNGDNTITAVLTNRYYDTTVDNAGTILVFNDLSALP